MAYAKLLKYHITQLSLIEHNYNLDLKIQPPRMTYRAI